MKPWAVCWSLLLSVCGAHAQAPAGASYSGALQEGVGGDATTHMGEAASRQAGRATDDEVAAAEQRVLTHQDLARIHQHVEQFVFVSAEGKEAINIYDTKDNQQRLAAATR